MKKIKIELTEEQQTWLLRRLNLDWDEEVNYQKSCGETDTSYLEDLLSCYAALLGKTDSFIIALCNMDDIETKQKEIEDLKNEEIHDS